MNDGRVLIPGLDHSLCEDGRWYPTDGYAIRAVADGKGKGRRKGTRTSDSGGAEAPSLWPHLA